MVSQEPDTKKDPSLDHAMDWTGNVCPGSWRRRDDVFPSPDSVHIHTVPSFDEVASVLASTGENETQKTHAEWALNL